VSETEPEALKELRVRGDELEPGEAALLIYQEILELDADDVAAANMVGRSLEALGRIADAQEHWHRMIQIQTDTTIAEQRLRNLKGHRRTSVSARVPRDRPSPAAIVEPVLAGPARQDCINALATSIRMIEALDPDRIAVTYRFGDRRFRVAGGMA
jgi:hypothetical protein